MNDYQNIIEEIKSNLTNDKIKNKDYLLEQTEKYKTHSMSHEILKEIGRMLYDNLSEEDKKSMASAIDQDLGNLNNKIEEANKYILQKDFSKAKNLLNEFLEAALTAYKEDQVTRYFSFKDIIEFYCSKGIINTDKKVVWVNLRYDVAYKLLGYIAIEEQEFEKARDYFEKGLYYNPMSTEIRFEKAESYKCQKDFDKMLEVIKDIYNYILDPHDLSKYYRLLGYYYVEKNKLDLAYSLYALSIYYENNEMAHHEINYIKQKLGQPDYKISTKKIISLIKNENISQSIAEENLTKLKQLASEKEVIENQSDLIKLLNSIIEIMSTPINQDQEIDGLEVSMPKITSEDIFDENKIILDDIDKARIKKNIDYLKQNNIPYLEESKVIPINSNTKLMNKKDVFDRALSEYVVASMALYALEGKTSSILNILDEMDEKLQVKKVLSNGDINDIHAIYDGRVPKQQLQDVSWLFEGSAVLLWALGLFKKPSSNQETRVNELDELFFNSTYDALLSKSNLLPKEEIMEFADLIFRYQWACREARAKNQQLSNLNELIVQEQRQELEWILNWKIESIMKEKIHVKYEKDDFNFELDIPTILKFSEVNSNKNPKRLFSLINPDHTIVVDFTNLGKEISLDVAFDRDTQYYESNGFNIIGRYDLITNNLKSKIKQLIANKKIANKLIGTSKYYFILNNHAFCMECMLLDDSINYQDINSIQNSKANNVMTGLLYSLHELGTNNINQTTIDIAKIMNYGLHAKQLDVPILNNFKVENSNEPSSSLYQDSMNMNGIEVPFNKGEGDTILADPNQLYKAAIESSVIQNLSIDSSDSNLVDNVKNLYRIILVCGEFENPILDENNLNEFLLDNNKVINLVRKFKEINQREFKNELSYLTFDVENNSLLNELIDMLRKSLKKK